MASWFNSTQRSTAARSLAESVPAIRCSVGASQKREVRSRLALIFQHLLKWHYQPALRARRRVNTLRVQRRDLEAVFEDSPSLRKFAAEERVWAMAFASGRQDAEQETGVFGIYDVSPWTLEQVLDPDFLPDDA